MAKAAGKKNAFYAQSGGVTAVINASACGVIEAARAFAGAVIGATDDRSSGLVARGTHPDVVEFEPTTTSSPAGGGSTTFPWT